MTVTHFFEGIGEAEYDGKYISISTANGTYRFLECDIQPGLVNDFGLELAVAGIITNALALYQESLGT